MNLNVLSSDWLDVSRGGSENVNTGRSSSVKIKHFSSPGQVLIRSPASCLWRVDRAG